MIATTLFMLAVLAIAYMEARTDAAAIARDQHIDHAGELTERVILVLGVGLALCLAFGLWQWRTLLWLPMAWGAFTPSFRWFLNRARGLNPWYLSWSNRYDSFWLGAIINLRRAGTFAYAFEVTVFLASLTAYAWA